MPSSSSRPPFGGPFRALRSAALALACALALPAGASAETLKLCHERIDVPPWRSIDGSGLNYELLTRVSRRLDVQFELLPMTWKRCFDLLKSNHVDGAYAVSFKPDRLAAAAYPGMPAGAAGPDPNLRFATDRYVLVRRKGSPLDWDGKALLNVNGAIGAQPEYSIGTQLRDLGAQVDDGSQNMVELLMKLAAGRLAGAAVLGSAAQIFTVKHPQLAAQLEILPVPLVEKSYYLVLSHGYVGKHSERAARLWKTIETVRKSGEYRKLEQDAFNGQPLRAPGPPG